MKIAKISLSVVIVAIIGWLTWNYFAGPLKHQRDMQSFVDDVALCETSTHDIWMPISGQTLVYAIDGTTDGRCGVRMDTPGPHVIRCAFKTEDLPGIAKGFADTANNIDMFGRVTIQVSTSNPDPLTEALNSEACSTTIE